MVSTVSCATFTGGDLVTVLGVEHSHVTIALVLSDDLHILDCSHDVSLGGEKLEAHESGVAVDEEKVVGTTWSRRQHRAA
jgi:hypothetical protein